jgi:hypothetical protein
MLLQEHVPVDPLHCEHCGGPMKIIAFVIEHSEITAILNHLGLPSEPPKVHRARGPPHARLSADDESQTVKDGNSTIVSDLADQDQSVNW